MIKAYLYYRKRALSYLRPHAEFNAVIHALGGIAIGILIASPLANPHPLRWAFVFASVSILGHLYALWNGKKK